MALPTPPDYTTAIPNNSFYAPEEYYVQGPYNPFIVGAGLSIDSEGILTAIGSGGGVNTIIAGTGISVSGPTGNVTISSTGVTGLVAGTGIALSGSTGNVTISATSAFNGTVTAVNTGVGLTGGPITTSGTISLASSGVTPGIYTNPTITVDTYGRIQLASNNTVVNNISVTAPLTIVGTTSPTLGVALGTTAAAGVVQLSNAVNDAASTCAASTAAVKTAYDVAIQAIPRTCVTSKGSLITGTAPATVTALPVGSDGLVLTACAACAMGLTWAAASTPPVATPNYGSFLGIPSQTPTSGTGVGIPVLLPTTVAANGFSIVSGSQVTAANAGIYNLQFSIQILSTGGGGGDVEIWLAKNGTAVQYSNTRFVIQNQNEAEFAALNYVESLAAGDYLELYWATDNNNIELHYATSAFGGPDIPAVILTIVPVGA